MKKITCALVMIACISSSSWAAVPLVKDLLKEAENNRIRFDKSYKGGSISVKGYVGSIEEIENSGYKLKLLGERGLYSPFYHIECQFRKAEERTLIKLNKGDVVIVEGTYLGKQNNQNSSIVLFNCTLKLLETQIESLENETFASQLISDLRNLKAAAIMFRADNYNVYDTIKPDIKLLLPYLDKTNRYTKNQGEYFFKKVDGISWVGYNFTISATVDKRKALCDKLATMRSATFFGNMNENTPYKGEDIVSLIVR